MNNRKLNSLSINARLRSKSLWLFAGVIAVIGVAVIVSVFATIYYLSVEPENGSLSGGARVITESNASAGKAVMFSNGHTTKHWVMTYGNLSTLKNADPTAVDYFFNTPNAFSASSVPPGLAATAAKDYSSFAQFSSDLASGAIPTSVHWVIYDNENWSATPAAEAQHPSSYMKQFADLAHLHNLKVYEVPARDLVQAPGADCAQLAGESTDQAYLRCGIPADAQYADIYGIQAEGDESSTSAYENLVVQAKRQVQNKSAGITVLSELMSDNFTTQQIYNCWNISHGDVAGYWMSTSSTSMTTAAKALDMIRTSGG